MNEIKRVKMVGVGGYSVSNGSGNVIKTMALGSCVGVVITSASKHVAGLLHIALPDSKIDRDRANNKPGYFADTGINALLETLKNRGINKRSDLIVKIAGGANVMDPNNFFNIGLKNVKSVKRQLAEKGLSIQAEDIGKDYSRTMWVEVESGRTFLASPGRGTWEL